MSRPIDTMLAALKYVRDEPERRRVAHGICTNVVNAYCNTEADDAAHAEFDPDDWLHDQFVAMGLHPSYPVPAPSAYLRDNPDCEHPNYFAYERYNDLWTGEYGASRLALLQKLIDRAEEQANAC
jgi:hypothetical protein